MWMFTEMCDVKLKWLLLYLIGLVTKKFHITYM